MSTRFKKNIENFVCEHCGAEVKGTGFTNHCPACLWSKHVDVYPGDRLEPCQGPMEPVGLQIRKGEYILLHRCIYCGEERPNKAVPGDNIDLLLE